MATTVHRVTIPLNFGPARTEKLGMLSMDSPAQEWRHEDVFDSGV